MKKIIKLGAIAIASSPLATLISCANESYKDIDGVAIGYWPDIDPVLALGGKISSAAQSSGHFATWFPKGSKYEKALEGLRVSKPLWDADTMDEEYWRNLNGHGENVNLSYEYWIKPTQKEFMKTDPKITPLEFDFNEGVPHEKYHWEISDGTSVKEILLENKGDKNYENAGDLWQIKDMSKILEKVAKSMDNAYDTNTFSQRAKNVIEVTNDHWKYFRSLQEGENKDLAEFTPEQLSNRDIDLSSERIDNQKTGTSSHDEKLLVLNLKTGASSAGSNDTMAFATPSVQKELYTKTHFTMPSINTFQFDIIKKQNNLKDNGHAIQSGATNNGIYFPNYSQTQLVQDFWQAWNGQVDKLVVGISHKEIENVREISELYTKFNNETDPTSAGATLKSLIGANLAPSNTVFVDTYLAGSGAYGYRMPIGQNVFIDKITSSFYGSDNKFDWQTRM